MQLCVPTRRRVSQKMGWGMTALLAVLALSAPVRGHAYARHGKEGEDRVGIFSTIVVSEERPAADVACVFCSVQINGDVHGDVAVLFSTVTVSDGRTISGDVATLFSTLVLGEGARVDGDLATIFGTASLAESAHVGGDRAVLSRGMRLTIILAPLLILAGLIWLLVWVVRRVMV